MLNVEFLMLNGGATLTVENMLGQTIYSAKTNQTTNTINLKQLESGIYFVRVNSAKTTAVIKFVKE